MTITKVKPALYGAGEKFPPADANSYDGKLVTALDKTAAGDQLEGAVTMAGTASITASSAGATIGTATGGRFVLGDSDYPTLSSLHTGRTRVQRRMITSYDPGTGWSRSSNGLSLLGPATTAPLVMSFVPHNGATISSLAFKFVVKTGHSALPAVFPSIDVRRYSPSTGADVGLNSAGPAFLSAGNVASYENGIGLTFSPDQNNVVDTADSGYYVVIKDESGTNALAGNAYYALTVHYSNILDMRFQ